MQLLKPIAIACMSTLLSLNAHATSFLVFGDMPYSEMDKAMLTKPNGALVKQAASVKHDFIVHVGDMKAGAAPCTDDLLQQNYALISSVSHQPFIYTPGDNDWTDCDREALNPKFDELERLNFVREHFAVQKPNLPHFERQSSMPENQAWRVDDVQFVTLHVPGTNNGRRQILLSDKKAVHAESHRRDTENMKWLTAHLAEQNTAAVVFLQADLYQPQKHSGRCDKDSKAKCDGYQLYRETLAQYAAKLDYPLLLIHGDTGEFCFSKQSSNLWRLNAPGDFQYLDIARVKIAQDKKQPFNVKPLLSKAKINACKQP
ncbi:metallophosphoesterase [Pseudoalteromonas piscicida]|uniref:metallophosphoesterase n=1 Tax=Pseudoalteromonas piscicida TaxID=43662 RepID=UPI0030A3B5B0